MNSINNNPTLDDVAAHAGVSTATVSRYFNNPDVVAEATARRIQDAVRATGYIPNLLAGGLASNKSRLVSLLIPQLGPSIFNDTMEALVNEFSASGYIVMLGLTELDADRTDDLIMAALGRRAEAIVLTGEVKEETRKILQRSRTSVIEIWDLPEKPVDIAIGFSHYEIGKDIARFLKARGYIRPHFITARGNRALQRQEAFVAEWKSQGGEYLTLDSLDIPLQFGQARGAFAKVRRLDVMPDVIVCGSDWLAQGLIIEAQAAGYNVPGDIAIIGFGNSALAEEMRPTITTVDIDGARIARESIALLRKREKGETVSEHHIDVGFRLIARESA